MSVDNTCFLSCTCFPFTLFPGSRLSISLSHRILLHVILGVSKSQFRLYIERFLLHSHALPVLTWVILWKSSMFWTIENIVSVSKWVNSVCDSRRSVVKLIINKKLSTFHFHTCYCLFRLGDLINLCNNCKIIGELQIVSHMILNTIKSTTRSTAKVRTCWQNSGYCSNSLSIFRHLEF